MEGHNDPQRAAKYAAWAFAVGGVVTIAGGVANSERFSREGGSVAPILGAGIGAILVGIIIPLLPWRRWNPRSTMVLFVLSVGMLTAAEFGSKSSRTADGAMSTATVVTLIFVWVGLTQPRWWSLASGPIVAICLAAAFTSEDAPISIATTVIGVMLSAAIGELVAWVKHADGTRSDELGLVIEATSGLRDDTDRLVAATRLVETVVALLRVPNVAVYLEGGEGAFTLAASVGDLTPAESRMDGAVQGIVVRAADGGTELMIPLVGRSGVARGVVVATGRRRQDEFMLRLAQILGEQVGYRLDDLAAFDALADETRRDALTGVGNRRMADELLRDLRDRDVIAIVDLDDLRGINERHGHQGGDQAIRAVARHLTESVRQGDAVARLGGDEFVMVLRDVGEAAFAIVARIAEEWNSANSGSTFSVGAAAHRGGDSESTVQAADSALFRAKREGRARARVAPAVPSDGVDEAAGF